MSWQSGIVAYHLTRRFRCSFSKTSQFILIPFVERNYRAYQTQIKLNNFSNSVTKRFFVSDKKQVKTMSSLSPLDPSSYSRPELAIIRHMSLNLNVNFEEKVLNGSALLQFEILKDVQELVLDASSLSIESVEFEDGTPLEYTVSSNLPNYGSKLSVNLPSKGNTGENEGSNSIIQQSKNCDVSTEVTPSFQQMALSFDGFMYKVMLPDNSGYKTCLNNCLCSTCYPYLNDNNRIKIKIKYSTTPTASALQWLEPNQTSSKEYPYLFSQCQPIHARSIVPCQDTPAVKFTYDAMVTAPEKFTVLMSAIRGETIANESRFSQPVPIPSYLLAIAVGVLENRRLGPRSLVWAEKEEIEKSAWEFAETENYLKAAERLCGPYVWTQYDLLVLPPSFPYGGMENPCLTFVTPTLLAGDRSQADVIVHEIMHSWTGNLVTNRNFEHFWLNEGFTVFLERKVGASLISNATEAKISRDFHSILGMQELTESIEHLGSSSPLTNLVVDLKGVHPDDAFSRVPYEKGSLFLRYLEDLVGGPEIFDDFLRAYLVKFQKRSIDTDQFKEFLLDYFKSSDALNEVDWNTWLHGSGMPPNIPNYDATMTKAVQAVLNKNGTCYPDDVANFTPHQMINLLQQFIERPPLPLDKLAEMGKAYGIDNSRNTEIKYRWLRMCIKSRDTGKLKDVFDFVNTQGRMKYVRPIYRDLYEWADVRTQAVENFLKNEPYMMHVSAYTLRNDLHLNDNTDTDN